MTIPSVRQMVLILLGGIGTFYLLVNVYLCFQTYRKNREIGFGVQNEPEKMDWSDFHKVHQLFIQEI